MGSNGRSKILITDDCNLYVRRCGESYVDAEFC